MEFGKGDDYKVAYDSWLEAYKYQQQKSIDEVEITKEIKDAAGNTVTLRNEEIGSFENAKKMLFSNFLPAEKKAADYMKQVKELRIYNVGLLMRVKSFFNRYGQPLRMMPKLELDPALLEQPLYH